jgi:hypothetical protein
MRPEQASTMLTVGVCSPYALPGTPRSLRASRRAAANRPGRVRAMGRRSDARATVDRRFRQRFVAAMEKDLDDSFSADRPPLTQRYARPGNSSCSTTPEHRRAVPPRPSDPSVAARRGGTGCNAATTAPPSRSPRPGPETGERGRRSHPSVVTGRQHHRSSLWDLALPQRNGARPVAPQRAPAGLRCAAS